MLHPDLTRRFQERARRRDVCLGVHSSAMSPQLVELYGHVGLDYVIISTEVESVDVRTMENLLRAADAGRTVPMVKLRWGEPRLVTEAMNAGAPMVMVPHVTSRAQLDDLVRAARFEPAGTRGLCPVSRYAAYGALSLDHVRELANRSNAVVPIIEDVAALEHLDEMMASSDVDIFEIGPFDLSQSLGLATPARSYGNPETMAAVERIAAAAQRHGKALLAPLWVTPETDSPGRVVAWNREQLVPRGINLLYGLEVVMIARAMRELGAVRGERTKD